MRAASGRIYEFQGDDDSLLDLGSADFGGDDWSEVETDEQTVKSGYTVRVDPLHGAGGAAGRVYRYIGVEVGYTTEEGEREVAAGDVVEVEITGLGILRNTVELVD